MSRILITGATGFVGACLTEDLVREGHEISVFARSSSSYMWRLNKVRDRINIYDVDLRNYAEVEKAVIEIQPEYIFHLATYGGFYFQQETEKIIDTNIIGTINLMNACSKVQYKRFINAGSSSEYGTKAQSMKETDLTEPINTYGVTKVAVTLYGQMLAKIESKPITTVRLFSPYGYYEDKTRLIPSAVLGCLRGENPKLASGEAVRDFIFIEDMVDLLKLFGFSEKLEKSIYNAGTGKQHSVKEMVDAIINESNTGVKAEWGSLPGRKSDTPKWEADMSLVNNEFGWTPKYTLEQGVRKTIEWFKENMHLYEE